MGNKEKSDREKEETQGQKCLTERVRRERESRSMRNKEKGDGEEEETQGEEWLTKRERIDGTGRKVREEEVTERKVAEKWKLEMMRVLLRQRERERERVN